MKKSGQLQYQNRLEDTAVFANDALNPLLRAALKKLAMPFAPLPRGDELYWPAAFFGLPELSLYQRLTADDQKQVLWHCNRMALEEAFYIEKSGMTYAAKMALLADTNDKRALYSLFCADEASHFHAINAFLLATPQDYSQQKFLVMLDQLIYDGSYNVLVYMIQIILEGWGLHHYRSLATYCQNPVLTEVLRSIVHDEAKHHGSGLVILPQETWNDRDSDICLPALKNFLELVRMGPTNLLSAFQSVLGPLSLLEKKRLFSDLNAETEIQQSLKTVGDFVLQYCPDPKLAILLKQSPSFTPVTALEFAERSSQ